MILKWIIFTIIFQFTPFQECWSARILGVFPTPSISHQVVYRSLMEELGKRGHQIVIMTTDPAEYDESVHNNIIQIDVHDISYKIWKKRMSYISDKKTVSEGMAALPPFGVTMLKITDAQLATPDMQKLIHDPSENFDLCFFEAFIPVMFPFSEIFKCPVVLISSSSGSMEVLDIVGNPTNPTMYKDLFFPHRGNLDFTNRLTAVYQDLSFRYYHYCTLLPLYEVVARKHFGEHIKSLSQIGSDNVDMLFLNGHPTLIGVRPTVPGIIYMDSMHIKQSKALPSDIQALLDSSSQGVIYFSLGSNVESNTLPTGMRDNFMDAFKELPYAVLWKWENETIPNKAINVFPLKWLPQQDIFNHPNVKAFITQGGFQSLEEAIHFGIPMIGLPIMGDQHHNVDKIVEKNIGVRIDFDSVTKDVIKTAVIDVIENPRYRKNIQNLSRLLKDQPQTAMERAVWWTEHVIRNKGAKHLRSPSADTPFYIYLMLDIIALAVFCLVLTIFVAYFTLKFIFNMYVKIKHYDNKKNKIE